jgi:hypothetical protein
MDSVQLESNISSIRKLSKLEKNLKQARLQKAHSERSIDHQVCRLNRQPDNFMSKTKG